MSDTVALPSAALTTAPTQGGTGACAQCGAAVTTLATTCARCGTAIGAGSAAEHGEKVRQRLQQAVGERFELLELLGRGGMGIVFRAREVALDREVALKVLALDPLLAPDAWSRFEREAKLAARLDHPNVVPIFSVGQGASIAYYTMRLVRGGNVEDLLAGSRQLDLTRTSAILRDVSAALDYAHRLGVVHRDIKPANILLGEGGHASVADFGIAKALGPADGTTATGTGIIGSPGYMSPEQWRGEAVDGRSDQYSLGIVAYEMLAGRRPFETVRAQDLLQLHLTAEVPDVCALRSDLEPAVGAAIRRALAKYPSERFPTTAAFVETLAGRRPVAVATTTRGTTATMAAARVAPPRRSTAGGALTALAVTLLVAGAGLGAAWQFAPATRPVVLRGLEMARGIAERVTPRALPEFISSRLPGASAPVAVAAAAPRDSAPAADSASAAVDPVRPESSLAATDSAAGAASDSTTPAPVPRERAPIGLDPALVSSATLEARPEPSIYDGVGYLRVVTHGGSARVRVDGRRYGFTPQLLKLDGGRHIVTVEGAGDAFLPSQLTVDVRSDDTTSAVFSAPGASRPRPDSVTTPGAAGVPQVTSDSAATLRR